ncbi:MAG: hypothetical protein RL095_250 [Verrucomicrobiota bacterium]|jgi:hypothetical protein
MDIEYIPLTADIDTLIASSEEAERTSEINLKLLYSKDSIKTLESIFGESQRNLDSIKFNQYTFTSGTPKSSSAKKTFGISNIAKLCLNRDFRGEDIVKCPITGGPDFVALYMSRFGLNDRSMALAAMKTIIAKIAVPEESINTLPVDNPFDQDKRFYRSVKLKNDEGVYRNYGGIGIPILATSGARKDDPRIAVIFDVAAQADSVQENDKFFSCYVFGDHDRLDEMDASRLLNKRVTYVISRSHVHWPERLEKALKFGRYASHFCDLTFCMHERDGALQEIGRCADLTKLLAAATSQGHLPTEIPKPEVDTKPVIEGLWLPASKLILAGISKETKSTLGYSAAEAISGGGKFLGRQCNELKVMVAFFEMSESEREIRGFVSGRNLVIKQYHSIRNSSLAVKERVITGIIDECIKLGVKVVFFDSLYKIFKERSDKEIDLLMKLCDWASDNGIATCYLHHLKSRMTPSDTYKSRIAGSDILSRDFGNFLFVNKENKKNPDCKAFTVHYDGRSGPPWMIHTEFIDGRHKVVEGQSIPSKGSKSKKKDLTTAKAKERLLNIEKTPFSREDACLEICRPGDISGTYAEKIVQDLEDSGFIVSPTRCPKAYRLTTQSKAG